MLQIYIHIETGVLCWNKQECHVEANINDILLLKPLDVTN